MNRREWLFAAGVGGLRFHRGRPADQFISRERPPQLAGAAPASLWDQFLAELPRMMEVAAVPGLSISLVEPARPPRRIDRGIREAGASDAIDAETVFEAASLGKPILARVFLKLAPTLHIDLDKPVPSYLEEGETGAVLNAITPRHLLTHTSGLPNWRLRPEQALQPQFPPGTRFSYSGEGFVLLSRMLEHETGEAFPTVVARELFAPLGMTRSRFTYEASPGYNVASGHSRAGERVPPRGRDLARRLLARLPAGGDTLERLTNLAARQALATMMPPLPTLPMYAVPNAASSMLTTSSDYGRFVSALHADRADPAVRAMLNPAVRINSAISWAAGLGLESSKQRPLAWHWGDNSGFKNFVALEPESGKALVMLTNGDNGMHLCERAVAAWASSQRDLFLWL